LIGSVLIT